LEKSSNWVGPTCRHLSDSAPAAFRLRPPWVAIARRFPLPPFFPAAISPRMCTMEKFSFTSPLPLSHRLLVLASTPAPPLGSSPLYTACHSRTNHWWPPTSSVISTSCSVTSPERSRRPSFSYKPQRRCSSIPLGTPSSLAASGPHLVKYPPPQAPPEYCASPRLVVPRWRPLVWPPTAVPHRRATRLCGEPRSGEPLFIRPPKTGSPTSSLALAASSGHQVVGHRWELVGTISRRHGSELPCSSSLGQKDKWAGNP
jgi:hypothetical protein